MAPRILHLTRFFPYPPNYGGDIAYSRGVIESLAKASDLTVLTETTGDPPSGVHVTPNGVTWNLVPKRRAPSKLSLLTHMPNIMWRHATRAYHARLAELLQQPWDGVVIDQLGTAHVLDQVGRWRAANPSARVLYLSHEHEEITRKEKYATFEGGLLNKLALRLDGMKIGHWEDRLLKATDIISAINPGEVALFSAQAPGRRYITTTPGYTGPKVEHRTIDASVPRRIGLLGGRGPVHKQVILKRWLEASADRFHDVGIELDIIGNIRPEFRAELEQRHPTVHFSGFVDDLTAHLQTCRMGVIPYFVGRGVKVRLLSYIYARTPLIGLEGAIDGLPIFSPADYREAKDLPGLASLCISLIDDFETLNSLQASAYEHCRDGFEWADRGKGIAAAIAADPHSLAVAATA